MAKGAENLIGKFCPYPVVTIRCRVGDMVHGETRSFIVDDPLATKSVPEELEDFDVDRFPPHCSGRLRIY